MKEEHATSDYSRKAGAVLNTQWGTAWGEPAKDWVWEPRPREAFWEGFLSRLPYELPNPVLFKLDHDPGQEITLVNHH